MSTDLARHEGSNLPERMQYAETLASASLLPRAYQQNPGNVLLAMELGDALGIPPIQAITGIHVIDGKPSASADLIASLVRKAGHKLRVTGDDKSATAQIIRADDPDFTYEATWTMDRAKAAGLTGKGVWKSYPAAMLKARAITEVARAGASDALYGVIYTSEELGAPVDASGAMADHATPSTAPARSGNARLAEAVQAHTPTAPTPAPVEDIQDAEVVPPDGGPEQEPGITQAQQRKLHALLREAGVGDRASGLAYIADVLGREVESTKTLTKSDAGAVIDALEAEVAAQRKPGPAPEPAGGEELLWPEVAQPGGGAA